MVNIILPKETKLSQQTIRFKFIVSKFYDIRVQRFKYYKIRIV